MKIILSNAKAFIKPTLTNSEVAYCKIYFDLSFPCLNITCSRGLLQSVHKIYFCPDFLKKEEGFDAYYFRHLIENHTNILHKKLRIDIVLNLAWVLKCDVPTLSTQGHQAEREAILWTQYAYGINTKMYDFIWSEEHKTFFAVEKILLENFKLIFKDYKLDKPLQFLIESL